MTSPDTPRHIEIRDGDQTVAAAEVTTSSEAGGTARASLNAASGHVPPGRRANLVDAVLDLPEVQASARLEAAVPLGDSESLERLGERTEDTVSRPAGSTALVEADIPPAGRPRLRARAMTPGWPVYPDSSQDRKARQLRNALNARIRGNMKVLLRTRQLRPRYLRK